MLKNLVQVSPHVWRMPLQLEAELCGDLPGLRLKGRRPKSNDFVEKLLAQCSDRVFEAGVLSRPAERYQEGYLKFKAYAHDRLVMTAGMRTAMGGKPRQSWGQTRPRLARGSSLVRPRETRRDCKERCADGDCGECVAHRERFGPWHIGGRERKIPPPTRFTPHGRNFVRDAGHLIERHNEGQAWFLTLTLPGSTQAAYRVLSAASGYVVDRLNRWLRYRVLNGWFVYVWEVQERGAGHLHYLFRTTGAAVQADIYQEVKNEWRKILLDVSNESGVDLFGRAEGGTWRTKWNQPRIDLQPVWFDLGCYVAKYASKNQSKDGHSTGWNPGRWWACSAPLRAKVLSERLTICISMRTWEEAKTALTNLLASTASLFTGTYKCPRVEFACQETWSCDVPVAQSARFAKALAELAEFGVADEIARITNEYRIVK
jgi:hypothetical protein